MISCAVDRKQASIIFEEMVAMLLADDRLAHRCNIVSAHKRIRDGITGSTYTALSADHRSMHGLSPTFGVYDEAAQSCDRRLWDAVSTAGGARRQPLTLRWGEAALRPRPAKVSSARGGGCSDHSLL